MPIERERFVGSLLGATFGDVLGAAVEMRSRGEIVAEFGVVRDFLPHEKGFGTYTDDTEMSLALACSIVERQGVAAEDCSCRYARAFSPGRGYGRSAVRVLEALAAGVDYRRTGTMLFPEGSFGNGAAMRIAPVGLLYGSREEALLRRAVDAAVCCTHVHGEAVEAAVLQAMAIGVMSGVSGAGELNPDNLLSLLQHTCRDSRIGNCLQQVGVLLQERAEGGQVVEQFSCGVRAADSWPPALWAALRFVSDPEEAIVEAVNLGGDTDTIGAMTGALVGALHGDSWFPRRWYEALENGPDGRDEIIRVAGRLADLSGSLHSSEPRA